MSAVLFLVFFIGLSVAEILAFIEVGGRIGGWSTVAATIATGITGVILFRVQGISALVAAKTNLEHGRMPLEELVGGVGLLFAAMCLLVPGFITDLIGLALFIPAVRVIVLAKLIHGMFMRSHISPSLWGKDLREPHQYSGTIDGEYEDVTENDGKLPPESLTYDRGVSGEQKGGTEP
ncbi:MAG: hypothetical protein CMM47_05400 [Rhodospirillaceae bacterium]|nr:hypothetical protein [Rhodospirillaceae bacterium]|tara:strand:+ start:493 stop:1026 length:534 start_codon:yes stop_codon:yes gene_type:complete